MRSPCPFLLIILVLSAQTLYAQELELRSCVYNSTGVSASVVNDVIYWYSGGNYYVGTFVTGGRTDTLHFGTLVHNPGSGGVFMARYDRYGNELWSKVSGTASTSGIEMGTAIGSDGDYLYNVGILDPEYPANFDGTIIGPGYGGFLAKYSQSGTLQWVQGYEHGIHSMSVLPGNMLINHGDSALIKLDPPTGEIFFIAPCSGDGIDILSHNICDLYGSSSSILVNLGNSIGVYSWSGEIIRFIPIEKPLGAKISSLSPNDWNTLGSFYADSGTVVFDGIAYGNMPQSYIYKVSMFGDVESCVPVGPFKVHQVFNYNSYFYLVAEYEPNDFRMVKVHENTLEEVASFPIFPTVKAIGTDQFLLGGYYSESLTVEGVEIQRPNDSGQRNAIWGYLVSSHVGMDEQNAHEQLSGNPNPATGSVTITSGIVTKLYIYSSIGQLIDTILLASGSTTIDLDAWPTGVFTLRTENGSVFRLIHQEQ
ncbi:MAG: T9SS type A sorting domain-containing protein [Flavobacteriales bacterium]|nr:T9SS type A sorting domain-containing protein [Flavobacteriales bacterium]